MDFNRSCIHRVFKAGLTRPAFFVLGMLLLLVASVAVPNEAQAACTQSVCYEYDVLGRVVKVTMPGGGPGGSDQVIEYVYDAAGNRIERTIGAPNQPPNAVNDSFTLNVGVALNLSVLNNDNDPEGQPLTITSVSTSTFGTTSIVSSGTKVRFVSNRSGSDTFTYTISDGHGGTDTASVNITVLADPEPCPTHPFCL